MVSFKSARLSMRQRRYLLPLAMLVLAAGVAMDALLQTLGEAFSFPSARTSGLAAQQRMQMQSEILSPQQHIFAGSSASALLSSASTVHNMDFEGAHSEARLSVIFAATALAAAAASESSSKEDGSAFGKVWSAVKLPVYVGLWYFFNIQYNIQNKMLLKCFSATWAVSWFQLFAGIPIALLMWGTGIVKAPSVTKSDMLKLAPVGAAFAAGQVSTVASLGAVAVSFTHVVKALEPAVNAIASAFVLGQVFHPLVYASLLPVFAGVALASASELSFTMFGFLTAMASNFFFVTRNVLATKYGKVGDMGEDQTTRKTNQLAVLTFVSTMVLLPIALLLPGGLRDAPAAFKAAVASGIPTGKLWYMLLASGFHFFMYQLSSFWVLSQVPPITHSVLNTLKRVVIIIMSIIVFRTPVTLQGALGTCIAIGGVLLYSLTKSYFAKKK